MFKEKLLIFQESLPEGRKIRSSADWMRILQESKLNLQMQKQREREDVIEDGASSLIAVVNKSGLVEDAINNNLAKEAPEFYINDKCKVMVIDRLESVFHPNFEKIFPDAADNLNDKFDWDSYSNKNGFFDKFFEGDEKIAEGDLAIIKSKFELKYQALSEDAKDKMTYKTLLTMVAVISILLYAEKQAASALNVLTYDLNNVDAEGKLSEDQINKREDIKKLFDEYGLLDTDFVLSHDRNDENFDFIKIAMPVLARKYYSGQISEEEKSTFISEYAKIIGKDEEVVVEDFDSYFTAESNYQKTKKETEGVTDLELLIYAFSTKEEEKEEEKEKEKEKKDSGVIASFIDGGVSDTVDTTASVTSANVITQNKPPQYLHEVIKNGVPISSGTELSCDFGQGFPIELRFDNKGVMRVLNNSNDQTVCNINLDNNPSKWDELRLAIDNFTANEVVKDLGMTELFTSTNPDKKRLFVYLLTPGRELGPYPSEWHISDNKEQKPYINLAVAKSYIKRFFGFKRGETGLGPNEWKTKMENIGDDSGFNMLTGEGKLKTISELNVEKFYRVKKSILDKFDNSDEEEAKNVV